MIRHYLTYQNEGLLFMMPLLLWNGRFGGSPRTTVLKTTHPCAWLLPKDHFRPDNLTL